MQIKQLDGGTTEIADAAFQEVRAAFRGKLMAPGSRRGESGFSGISLAAEKG